MNFEFRIPSEGIIFGPGKLSTAGILVKQFGKRCLIVCGKHSVKSGLAERLQALIVEQDVKCDIYDKVIPNPTLEIIDEGGCRARAGKCDFIVGLGGGSSIDAAKGIAVAATHVGSVWKYAMGEAQITDRTLPIIAINTTAGTGSHCTCFSVISNNETHQKPGMGSPFITPSLAIVDPELMLSVSPNMTLLTGFDVFAHAVEAYTSKAATPVSDVFAEKAILLIAENLSEAYRQPDNLKARCGMALADTYSGIAINHAIVSLGHALAHVISGHFPEIAHGDALYSIYGEVLNFNSKAMPEKHRRIAEMIDNGNKDIVRAFQNFFEAFTFDNALKKKNPGKKKIDELAKDTYTYMKPVTQLNPVENGIDDAIGILENSLR